MLQDKKVTSGAVKPATLQSKKAFIGSSVVSGRHEKADRSGDLVLRGG
jgi:hypothetical protein